MEKAQIRLWIPIPTFYNPGHKDWSYIGLRYLKACDETQIPVKAITTTIGADIGEETPWFKYAHLFLAELDDKPKINVVLGFGGTFEKFYTEDMINIGITASYPRTQRIEEISILKKYDSVWAISSKTQEDLNKIEISANVIPPEPLIIKAALHAFLTNDPSFRT